MCDGELPTSLSALGEVVKTTNRDVTIQLLPGQKSTDLLKLFVNNGNEVHAFNEILPTLNEIFIKQVEQSVS